MIPRARILIVEDEEPVRAAVEASLKRNGFSVAIAENGVEAMKLLTGEPFDVVLTDMNMPAMDGLELIRQIRQHGLGVAVIPMSGATAESYGLLAEAVRLAGRPPLEKPFKMGQLLAAVETALAQQKGRTG